jgi:glucosamine kinase
MVHSSLSAIFTKAEVNVHSDILGAARALFGNGSGLVLILGTGANVGLYDGYEVKNLTPSLGYILGDEGSGAHLGKLLLRSWFYGELPVELMNKLEQFCPLTLSEILMKVYSDSGSAMFLSSFTRFLYDNINEQPIIDIVENSFTDLWNNHIVRYSNIAELPIGAVGSIASTFSNQLKQVFGNHGCVIQNIIQYPIERLAAYHTIHNL